MSAPLYSLEVEEDGELGDLEGLDSVLVMASGFAASWVRKVGNFV